MAILIGGFVMRVVAYITLKISGRYLEHQLRKQGDVNDAFYYSINNDIKCATHQIATEMALLHQLIK